MEKLYQFCKYPDQVVAKPEVRVYVLSHFLSACLAGVLEVVPFVVNSNWYIYRRFLILLLVDVLDWYLTANNIYMSNLCHLLLLQKSKVPIINPCRNANDKLLHKSRVLALNNKNWFMWMSWSFIWLIVFSRFI